MNGNFHAAQKLQQNSLIYMDNLVLMLVSLPVPLPSPYVIGGQYLHVVPFIYMPGLQGAQSSSLPETGREVDPFTLLAQILGSIHWNIFLNWSMKRIGKRIIDDFLWTSSGGNPIPFLAIWLAVQVEGIWKFLGFGKLTGTKSVILLSGRAGKYCEKLRYERWR